MKFLLGTSISLRNKVRSTNIRKRLGTELMVENIQEYKRKLYNHVGRIPPEQLSRQTLESSDTGQHGHISSLVLELVLAKFLNLKKKETRGPKIGNEGSSNYYPHLETAFIFAQGSESHCCLLDGHVRICLHSEVILRRSFPFI
jgi:hypothetical protein